MVQALNERLSRAEMRAAKFLHWLSFKPYAGGLALLGLCLLLFLPGIASLPVTDRDEARFAQSSKQMLESGELIDIRFQGEPRYKKPIGIYWLQTASAAAAGVFGAKPNDIWAYRLPSFLAGVGAVLLLYWAARPVVGRKAAFIAGALFASTLMLVFEAHIAKSDAALTFALVLSQGALLRLYLSPPGARTKALAVLFWAAVGVGILIKGPIAPALAALTIGAVLWRDKNRAWFSHLHWRWGVPLLLVITLPWFIAIGIASGGAFFKSSLGQDFAGKIASGQEAHGAPPGFYLVLMWITFWPSVLFLTWSAARWLYRARSTRRITFLAAWTLPFWLLIEAVPTKLPHYALPLYPALALLAALALSAAGDTDRGAPSRWRLSPVLWAGVALAHVAALASLAWLTEADGGAVLAIGLALYAGIAALTVASAFLRLPTITLFSAIASGALFFGLVFFSLPRFTPLWISEGVHRAQTALVACGRGAIGLSGYSEPSAVFLSGTETMLAPPPAAASALAGGQTRLSFVSSRNAKDFALAYKGLAGAEPVELGCVDGFNMNGKGPTRLLIYAPSAAAGQAGCMPPPEELRCLDQARVRWRRRLNAF